MSVATDEVYAANRSVIAECERLRKSMQIISDKNHGPLEKSEIKSTLFPFVLLLGNHSSGKSSFVNYLMDRKIQTAGVAPTDDNFTIIAPGETSDIDRDGSSLVGDPDLGFQGLKHFGPVLVHRTQLKIRAGTRVKGFCVVDTPGMIDSPIVKDHFGSGRHSVMDRGYDFEAVCRWYAERADVILLFFDPDKPGTTGETLSILTNSLNGMDHKLHIILNKADQFLKIHDFARAYGSLCWNLSKVIPRKDLPQIHTMCLPIGSAGNFSPVGTLNSAAEANYLTSPIRNGAKDLPTVAVEIAASSSYLLSSESNFLRQGYADLEESRIEVTREVFNAPKRRVDHEISRLSDSVYLLLMHCKVIDSTVSKYKSRVWAHRLGMFAAGCAVAVTGFAVGAFILHSNKRPALITISDATAAPVPAVETISPVSDEASHSVLGKFFSSKDNASSSSSAASSAATSTAAAAVQTFSSTEAKETIDRDTLLAKNFSILKSVLGFAVSSVTFLTGLAWYQDWSLDIFASSLITEDGFDETFSKLYARSIAEKDEFSKALWQKVRSKLSRSVTYVELSAMKRVLGSDISMLERILEEDIANLRRQASPNFPPSKSSRTPKPQLPHRVAFTTPSVFPLVGNEGSASATPVPLPATGASLVSSSMPPAAVTSPASATTPSRSSSSSIPVSMSVTQTALTPTAVTAQALTDTAAADDVTPTVDHVTVEATSSHTQVNDDAVSVSHDDSAGSHSESV